MRVMVIVMKCCSVKNKQPKYWPTALHLVREQAERMLWDSYLSGASLHKVWRKHVSRKRQHKGVSLLQVFTIDTNIRLQDRRNSGNRAIVVSAWQFSPLFISYLCTKMGF